MYFSLISTLCFSAVAATPVNQANSAKDASVIIIGAGISGLGAADYLINEYNFRNVIILEALDRIGGRIWPTPFENGIIEKGAQWVHGENNPIFALAKQLKALASQSNADRYDGDETEFYTQNGCVMEKGTKKELMTLYKKIDMKADNTDDSSTAVSVARLYRQLFDKFGCSKKGLAQNYVESLFEFKKKTFEAENSVGDWNRASLRQIYEYETTVGCSDCPLGPMGYKPILDYFINRIPGAAFHLKTTVKKITYRQQNEPAIIETSNGQTFTADHVIVTASLGYLKKFAKEMFDPQLPEEKLKTIMALGFDAVEKLFLIFDKPFWNSGNPPVMNLLRLNNTQACNSRIKPEVETSLSRMFFGFDPHPFYENVLLAFIRGDDPNLLAKSTDEEIKNAAAEVFRRFLNNPEIKKPTQIIRSSWMSEPTILGSYSYYSTECERIRCERKTLSAPVYKTRKGVQTPTIFFAGEATSEHEFQTTHGALKSGQIEAKKINDFYSKRKNN